MGSRCWGTQTMGSRSLNALIFSWAQLIAMFTAAARFLAQIGLSAKCQISDFSELFHVTGNAPAKSTREGGGSTKWASAFSHVYIVYV